MLTYDLSDTGSDSLYVHLYKCLKDDILSGILPPDTRLPSKRSFAKNLGVSSITVENAYAQLQAEGFIYSLPKKGFYVTHIENSKIPVGEVSSAGQPSVSMQLQDANAPVYTADLLSNQTAPDNFPFSNWARLMRETLAEDQDMLMKNPPYGGVCELRQAICLHLKQFRNMNILPDQVIVGAGTEYLYSLLIQLLGRDKVYAVENPGYKKIVQIYESQQVTCRYVPMDDHGLLIDALETCGADVAHVSPSHHYPTGIVTPVSRRYALLGWASEKPGRYIIEDDYDSEFRLTGRPVPTLQSIDVSEKVIYMNTFTKSLASTIRISYMVLPVQLSARYRRQLGFYACTVSTFEQYALARFIQEGFLEKHINRMRNYYRSLRDNLLTAIKSGSLSDIVSISEEEAGLHFLMHVRTSLSDAALIQKADRLGLNIACLSGYFFGEVKAPQHVLVINYSGIRRENIPQTINLLSKCLKA